MLSANLIYNFRLMTGFVMAGIGFGAALSTTVGMLIHLSNKRKENYPIAYGTLFAILAPFGLLTIPLPTISKYWPVGILINPLLVFMILMFVEESEKKKKKK